VITVTDRLILLRAILSGIDVEEASSLIGPCRSCAGSDDGDNNMTGSSNFLILRLVGSHSRLKILISS